MTEKTQAIVLSLSKHKDNLCILHLYTAAHGRESYAVYGNKYKGLLSPLSWVEVTSSVRASKGMPVVSSVSLVYHPRNLPNDIKRQCVAMFIAEILGLTLLHPMEDAALFDLLCSVVRDTDLRRDIENVHLAFLLQYAALLGIGIDAEEHPAWYSQPATREERQRRLHDLCAYYERHIDTFTSPKSLPVLMEVFD